jgi:hypothetical protein
MGSHAPGGSYLVTKWTIKKAEFNGRVLEDEKLIEVIRKEVKDIVFTENLSAEKQDGSLYAIKYYTFHFKMLQ